MTQKRLQKESIYADYDEDGDDRGGIEHKIDDDGTTQQRPGF